MIYKVSTFNRLFTLLLVPSNGLRVSNIEHCCSHDIGIERIYTLFYVVHAKKKIVRQC